MKICPGDLHIHDDSRYAQIKGLLLYLVGKHPAEVIFSEVIDPWVEPWEVIAQTDTFRLLRITVALLMSQNCRVIIVLGNHDHRERKHYEQAFPSVEIVHTYEDEFYRYEHGWQQDFVWNIISPVAFWIAHKFPTLAVWIHSTFIRKTPAKRKAEMESALSVVEPRPLGATVAEYRKDVSDWNMHVGLIHDRYRNKARKGKPFVIWHTHCPWAFDGLIADCGDMVDSFSWLEIDGPRVELKYLER